VFFFCNLIFAYHTIHIISYIIVIEQH